MFDQLFIKCLGEWNEIDISNADIINGSHRINTYPYLVTTYSDIFLLNIKDMSITL